MSKILVVEDEMVISMEIQETLRRLGYEVAGHAISGEEAVKNAKETDPDLILMDIRLQGSMDGIEAARIIQADVDIPIIFLTAHSDKVTLERAIAVSPSGYLIKPFKDRELYSNIEMNLQKQHIRRERLPGVSSREISQIRSPCIAIDMNGIILRVNEPLLDLIGRSRASLTGTPVEELIGDLPEMMAHSCPAYLMHASGRQIPIRIELGFRKHGRMIRELLLFLSPEMERRDDQPDGIHLGSA